MLKHVTQKDTLRDAWALPEVITHLMISFAQQCHTNPTVRVDGMLVRSGTGTPLTVSHKYIGDLQG